MVTHGHTWCSSPVDDGSPTGPRTSARLCDVRHAAVELHSTGWGAGLPRTCSSLPPPHRPASHCLTPAAPMHSSNVKLRSSCPVATSSICSTCSSCRDACIHRSAGCRGRDRVETGLSSWDQTKPPDNAQPASPVTIQQSKQSSSAQGHTAGSDSYVWHHPHLSDATSSQHSSRLATTSCVPAGAEGLLGLTCPAAGSSAGAWWATPRASSARQALLHKATAEPS